MKEKILVIDDNEDTNELMCDVLREAGYVVSSAYDGEEGVKAAMNIEPDLILLDIMMPGLDGIKTCQILKKCEKTSRIPVVMVTAKIDMETRKASFASGARKYIIKPFDIDDLIQQAEEALRPGCIGRIRTISDN